MALKRLAEKCSDCPFVDKCDHKQMEALGYFQEPLVAEVKAPSAVEMTEPILRETVNTIVDGKVIKVYKDEIGKQFYKELYSHLGLQYGG